MKHEKDKMKKKKEHKKKEHKKKHPMGKVEKVMHEFKEHTLHSGSKKGPKVKSRAQAIAIGLSEARKAGEARRSHAKTGEAVKPKKYK
jgi:hypothetical protein